MVMCLCMCNCVECDCHCHCRTGIRRIAAFGFLSYCVLCNCILFWIIPIRLYALAWLLRHLRLLAETLCVCVSMPMPTRIKFAFVFLFSECTLQRAPLILFDEYTHRKKLFLFYVCVVRCSLGTRRAAAIQTFFHFMNFSVWCWVRLVGILRSESSIRENWNLCVCTRLRRVHKILFRWMWCCWCSDDEDLSLSRFLLSLSVMAASQL